MAHTAPTQTQRPPALLSLNESITLNAQSGLTLERDMGSNGGIRTVVLKFTNYVVNLTDDGATGHGGAKLFDFPGGSIAFMGGLLSGTLVATAGGNIQVSLGTTLSADATLSGTDADICPASTASASRFDAQRTSVGAVLDGTGTAKSCNINVGTAGDPSSGATVTLNGYAVVKWYNQGDYTS